jgi:hypothetical protein
VKDAILMCTRNNLAPTDQPIVPHATDLITGRQNALTMTKPDLNWMVDIRMLTVENVTIKIIRQLFRLYNTKTLIGNAKAVIFNCFHIFSHDWFCPVTAW